ncbi:MAG: hypothetical protein HY075_09795 [Deltaproteobacteria bacterium]|nr:hypothetical protein [Deltaproteobacteria bacterium]
MLPGRRIFAFASRGALLLALALVVGATAYGVQPLDPRLRNKIPVRKPRPVEQEEPSVLITPELEEQLVDFFTRDRCDRVRGAAPRAIQRRLSPLVAAVVAYCQSDPLEAEQLFSWAEEREPTRDTIVVLHARYRWKLNPASALPLWAKVVLITRNQATKALAQQYLAGIAEGDDLVEIGKKTNFFGTLVVGASRESNPLGIAISEAPVASVAANAQANATYTEQLDNGSWSAGAGLLNNRYFTAHSADLLEADTELSLALRVGKNEDFTFRPFFSYLTLGNLPYESFGGIALRGVAYRDYYKQYVQGTIYQDWYYRNEYKPQAGWHFRFDYNWELFPFPWFASFGAYFEHVRAARDTDDANALTITYSHNDIGIQLFAEHNFRLFAPGLNTKLYLRNDADVSSFNRLSTGGLTTKRRQDLTLEITPSFTIPLETNYHLYIWYTFSRTFSNLGADDYADRNVRNSTVGAALKAYIIK